MGAFGKVSIGKLIERVAYELWLIEKSYEVTDRRLAVEDVDELIYPPAGGVPVVTIYGMANIVQGDWRPGFLRAGAPLILVTCFKLIDMLVEWMLQENGLPVSFRFKQKMRDLKKLSRYPALFTALPWLKERVLGLYKTLEPMRGAIIHSRIHSGENGNVSIQSTNANSSPLTAEVSASDLESLARITISLYHYIDGTWSMDLFKEKRLAKRLDDIAGLHGLSALGQLEPGFLNVRVYAREGKNVVVDLGRIRADIVAKRPNQDVMFDVRIVSVAPGGTYAKAYLWPWDRHKDEHGLLTLTPYDYARSPASLPTNLDMAELSRQLDALLA